ncbi:PQQ-like beta-propeller repeat protein [Akkermansiaceae bacterium]|nr:PQQ-like beta-propeller repeat protein [Akkermansiaceae bacterium]MDB4429578.1 PQQ-like beta-propeller repeat protein [Akkermansiaceae bacterium]MDB4525575.1 PQQ-like beta-propeller repeat protein [Akkermansiaceae bacterium]
MIRESLLVSFLLVPLLGAQEPAKQWSQFRGPGGKGIIETKPTPTTWNVETGENILWKTPIPGTAHSAPIIWDERIYLTTVVSPTEAELKIGLYGDISSANDVGIHNWRLLAIDRATGKIIYDKLGHEAEPRSQRHRKATQCNSTPATNGKYIVAYFGSEGIFCFDMEGTLVWKKDLGPMNAGFFKMPTAQWGFATSPVIHDDKVIVQCDVQKDAFLAVFDLATGDELWRTPRKDVPTWSTPAVAQWEGNTQILINGWHHSGAYDFKTGKEIWKLKGGGDIPVPTPIVGKDMAYFTSAHGMYRPIRGIRLSAKGDITPPEVKDTNESIAWVHHRKGNYMQTPILIGDRIYACSDRGVLTSFNATDGSILFSERLKGNGFTASPVSDGRHLYITAEFGEVWVSKPGDTYQEVAINELGDSCLATPAIADGTIYFRTLKSLIAVGK